MRKWKNPSGTRTYYAWRSMRARCYNPSAPSYKHYGARGITVCPEWVNDYDQFVLDMGLAPKNKSIDRIDNDFGYYPVNCRWATLKEQLNNQRRNRMLEFKGVTRTLSQWAETFGMEPDTLWRRLERMPIERAFQSGRLNAWRHGTRQGYESHKCKCSMCREANARRHRERRAAKKESTK